MINYQNNYCGGLLIIKAVLTGPMAQSEEISQSEDV